jgi:OmpA-OmpF porin, OOP family
MCQPSRWWWGLLPLAALWWGAMTLLTPEIESELTHRVKTIIAKDLPWAKTALEGRDVFIEGMAPSEGAQRRAAQAALEANGVRLVYTNPADVAPETKPFTWGASRDTSKVTLSGYVEVEGMRELLLAEARKTLPNMTIVDEMKEARGAPQGSLAMMTVALGQLANLKSGSVALTDNVFSIKGTAADQAAAARIAVLSRQLPHSMQLAKADISLPAPPPSSSQAATPPVPKGPLLPVERPYVWQATKEGDVITLNGFAPSEAARVQVVAAAKSATGSGRVVDQLKIATGLPSGIDFNAAASFATTQLGQLRFGSAKLTDGTLVVEGEALDAAAYRAASAATSGVLPGGVKLDRASFIPPLVNNYVWAAKRDAKSLSFAGHYPDEETGRTMQSALQRFPNSLVLNDRTSIASGAPSGFAPAMAMGLDQLSRLDSGEALIANGRFSISGVAPSERIANEVKDAVAKLVGGMPTEVRVTFAAPVIAPVPPATAAAPAPSAPAPPQPSAPAALPSAAASPTVAPKAGPTVASTVTPAVGPAPPPAPAPPAAAAPAPSQTASEAMVCATNLAASAKSGEILFQSSRAVVLPSSQPVINQIAGVLKRCPAMHIEIAGHTDSSGTPGFNEALAQGRAAAIAALLVKSGIPAARMKAVGYGSSQPVAENETPEGRAKNRRIEFNVFN